MIQFSPERLEQAMANAGSRRKVPISLEDVASVARCSSQTVRRWRNGEQVPDANDLALIAPFLGVSVEFFFTEAA